MKRLINIFKSLFFFHFAPDNHVSPVLRLGRYHRVDGPGFFWTIPLLEQALSPVKTGLHVGNFSFTETLSQDNIPFTVRMTVLFSFKPQSALKTAAAQLVLEGDDLLQLIVKEYTSQGLRRLTAKFKAEKLSSGEARFSIEQNLARFLLAELRALGLAPLANGGILIKEVVGHDKFRRAMLDAKRLDANLQVVTSYHAVGNLIQQAIQAGFVTSLEELDGNLTLLSTLAPLESIHPSYSMKLNQMPMVQNRQHTRNGH